MKVLVCVLFAVGLATGQLEGPIDAAAGPADTLGANTLSANPPAAGAPSAGPPAASAGAGARTGAAGRAGAAPGRRVLTQAELGPAFYGSGLDNPAAFPPNAFELSQAKQIAARNPNVRVRVSRTGRVEYTNVFGEEIDEELLGVVDFEEQQEFAMQAQARAFEQRKLQLQAQLLREFNLGGAGAQGDLVL